MVAGVIKSGDEGGSRRRRRRARRTQPMSEINVTPFVDVMLVLLIIFMVAAPLTDRWRSGAIAGVECQCFADRSGRTADRDDYGRQGAR